MMIPDWPHLAGAAGHWMFLGLKIAAALGFAFAANLVILYAS
jgi:hypothetical protein